MYKREVKLQSSLATGTGRAGNLPRGRATSARKPPPHSACLFPSETVHAHLPPCSGCPFPSEILHGQAQSSLDSAYPYQFPSVLFTVYLMFSTRNPVKSWKTTHFSQVSLCLLFASYTFLAPSRALYVNMRRFESSGNPQRFLDAFNLCLNSAFLEADNDSARIWRPRLKQVECGWQCGEKLQQLNAPIIIWRSVPTFLFCLLTTTRICSFMRNESEYFKQGWASN